MGTQPINVNGSRVWAWIRQNWAILIALAVWAVRVEVFIQTGPRFTEKDGELLRASISEEVSVEIRKLPPQWYKDQVEKDIIRLEVKLDEVLDELRELRKARK